MYLASISLHPLHCYCWSACVNKLLFSPLGLVCLFAEFCTEVWIQDGPKPSPTTTNLCSRGSGPISRYNPGLMISPSTVITPVPGAPSLAQCARHTYSFSFSQPSGHKAHTGKGVTVKSLSPTPWPCAQAGSGGGLCCAGPTNWTSISGGRKITPLLHGTGLPLADLPACLQLQ